MNATGKTYHLFVEFLLVFYNISDKKSCSKLDFFSVFIIFGGMLLERLSSSI